jgi:5-(carboxyamino)imidazole ribonucleotide synthase
MGSGQLGRMFALAARRMGYRVHTFSPASDTPTGQVSDKEFQASYEDLDAVRVFAQGVDVVTFEFENVPSVVVEAVEAFKPVRPQGSVLHTTQHRLREKTFLLKNHFPVAAFRSVTSLDDLKGALQALGTPAVLKTAGFGYDGKGQQKIMSADEAPGVFAGLQGEEGILEEFVDFEKEVSVVSARGMNGAVLHYPVIENRHQNHILDLSFCPAVLSPSLAGQAQEMAADLLKTLDVVGVLCVEFFLTRKGRLLINELAPRPHNSGHLTVDGAVTSQFEQQLRAVAGLPLGATDLLYPTAMVNLLGDLWQKGTPHWSRALALPDIKLHLYGKTEPRPGRKMGHLTALAPTSEEAQRLVLDARRSLE